MLRYRDFVPEVRKPPSVIGFGATDAGEADPFDVVVEAAAEWIKSEGIRVLNVETVVLEMRNDAAGSSSQSTGFAGSGAWFWLQFVRVWYDDEPQQPYR